MSEWVLDVKPPPLVPMPFDDHPMFDEKWIDFLIYTDRLYGYTQMAARLLTAVANLGEPMMRMHLRMMLQKMQVYYLRANCHRGLEELRCTSRVSTLGGMGVRIDLGPHAYLGETAMNSGAHGITDGVRLDSESEVE